MTRLVRGVLARAVGPSDVVTRLLVDDATRSMTVDVLDRPVPAEAGASAIAAEATVAIGVHDRLFRVLVAAGGGRAPVPFAGRPNGLRMTPVVVLAGAQPELVDAGARRSGKGAMIRCLAAAEPGLAARSLRAVSEGAQVLIVTGGDHRTLELGRILGGRPIPVAPLGDADVIEALLDGVRVTVDVPIPSLEGRERERAWELVRRLELDRRHHVVEVDPRPAFEELGLDPQVASPAERAAGAAGVLAGRLAAGNRRWHVTLD